MDKSLLKYRHDLIQAVFKLNENYDKLIITLAGGALGLSLVFIRDFVGDEQIQNTTLLILSWFFFILCLIAILIALLFGIEAHKKAIKQVDSDTIYVEKPGGLFSVLTTVLHYSGTVFLITGFILMVSFVYTNLEVKNVKRGKASKANTAEATATNASTKSEKR
jgi:hypothetical protein